MRTPLLLTVAMVTAMTGCSSTPVDGKTDLSRYMYVRGVFTGWDALDEFQLQPLGDDRFGAEAKLEADGKPYYFKFADAGWVDGSNCGPAAGPDNEVVTLDNSVTANCSEPRRSFKFTPAVSGRYRFVIDNGGPEPKVSVEAL